MAVLLGILAAAAASAPTPQGSAAAPSTPLTIQQIFDTASADAAAKRCNPAVTAFQTLLTRPAVARNAAVMGAIQSRMGGCLYWLGKTEEARIALTDSLMRLPVADPNYRNDRLDAHTLLGRMTYEDLDHSGSLPHFRSALTSAETVWEKVRTRIWLARAEMFIDGPAAQAHADEALRLALAETGVKREVLGEIRTIRGRVLLNRGQVAEAFTELRKSVTEQGGLTTRVTLSDVITRSDLAVAALLNKNAEAAREYMAYTGAGRFEDAPFSRARRADPPPCGGPDGLRPEDSAIVEFGITDQGVTTVVQPVWASRSGPVAVAFAKAVENWSWAPEDLAKIPPFFRLVTRVELRCSNKADRPSIFASLNDAREQWLTAARLPTPALEGSDAVVFPKLLAELARLEKGGETAQTMPVLVALAENPVSPYPPRSGWVERAVMLAKAAGAPVAAEASIHLLHPKFRSSRDGARTSLTAMLKDSRYASDAEVDTTVRLALAETYTGTTSADALQLLTTVAEDKRLTERHPLRIAALVRLADANARRGDLAAARQNYMLTGLNDQQCALVGSTLAIRSHGGSFPQEAMRWGFEGWVQLETDVAADGRTLNQRAVIAYPPFVFRDAALGLARSLRFNPTFRPSGDAACSAYQSTVRFSIPK